MSSFNQPQLQRRIAANFSRHASHYERDATVQAAVADEALGRIPNGIGTLLDIGCGTGRASNILADRCEQVLAVDLAEGMLKVASQQAKHNVRLLLGHAAQLPLSTASVDQVFSSMVLQWCDPLSPAIVEISRVLKQGGRATLALMTQGSFFELSECWRACGVEPRVNRFVDPVCITSAAKMAGLTINIELQDYTSWHPSLLALLRSIKQVGASSVDVEKHRYLSRPFLAQLEQEYRHRYGDKQSLPLTYRIGFVELIK